MALQTDRRRTLRTVLRLGIFLRDGSFECIQTPGARRTPQKAPALARDLPFLLSGKDQDPRAEKSNLAGHRIAQRRAIFADSAGEHDRLDAAERRGHGADSDAQPMRVNVEGQLRAWIALVDRLKNFAHIAGD